MSDNPFQSPAEFEHAPVVGVLSGQREDVRLVAVYQRGIMFCILAQFILYAAVLASTNTPVPLVGLAFLGLMLVVNLIGLVFVVLLAIKVYHVAIGILLIPFMVFPCINLLILLAVNGKATSVLKSNGYRVGLLGVALSEFDRPPTE